MTGYTYRDKTSNKIISIACLYERWRYTVDKHRNRDTFSQYIDRLMLKGRLEDVDEEDKTND